MSSWSGPVGRPPTLVMANSTMRWVPRFMPDSSEPGNATSRARFASIVTGMFTSVLAPSALETRMRMVLLPLMPFGAVTA